jgi:flavin-dependent dehydrogenase
MELEPLERVVLILRLYEVKIKTLNLHFYISLTFECIDASGWIWYIPLHDGNVSVGVVMNQNNSTSKKRAADLDSKGLYLDEIKSSPGISKLLKNAELTSDLKSASDWSYSAPAYASPYVRLAGDAACFIDPFFSSGVHLALASGLSAAVTICASIKNQCSELDAATWHSKKVAEGYTRFLLVVSSALKQIKSQDQPVISDWDEKTFDRAFNHFRPSKLALISYTALISNFAFQSFKVLPMLPASCPKTRSLRRSTSASKLLSRYL